VGYCPPLHAEVGPVRAVPPGWSRVLEVSGAGTAPGLAPTLATRARVLALSQLAEDAVLRPADPGGWCHETRAALAARVARLNHEDALANHHLARAGAYSALGNPAHVGQGARIRAALAFLDVLSQDPRDMDGNDVSRLHHVGISDADIVRLADLGAFLSFQVRLVAGLRLLAEAQP